MNIINLIERLEAEEYTLELHAMIWCVFKGHKFISFDGYVIQFLNDTILPNTPLYMLWSKQDMMPISEVPDAIKNLRSLLSGSNTPEDRSVSKLIAQLDRMTDCTQCGCTSCTHYGNGENHNHSCTKGKHCLETKPKLKLRLHRSKQLMCQASAELSKFNRLEKDDYALNENGEQDNE